jgi:hypothetical protein
MKKIRILIIAMVLTVSLVGCSFEPGGSEKAIPGASSADESTEAAESEVVTESLTAEPAQSASISVSYKSEPVAVRTLAKTESTNKLESPKPDTAKLTAKKSASTTKAKKKKKKKKSAYKAPYNKKKIIADAKAYGKKLGMTWSPTLTKNNCGWDAPFQTSSTLSGTRLKKAIQYGIRYVKKIQTNEGYQPGEFHFKIYLEKYKDGEYSVYHFIG